MGAAGSGGPSEDQFNRVSFLSHFEGSNNGVNNAFDDGSSNNHTITAAGNVTQGSFGPFARPDGEWGWSFDGNGDSLTFTNDATMSLDGDYTFELFFNARTIVIDTQHPNTILIGSTQLYIHASDRYVSWYAGGGNIVHSANNSILTNVWNHVAVVRSGSGSNNTSMYLNGTRVQQATNTATLGASSGTARIGSYSDSGGNFDGHISNIRILKGTALYSGSSITVPTSKLTAVTNTKLLTCQSNRFIDNSSTGFALTPVGNPAVTAFGPILTRKVYDPAVNGASAHFEGGDDDYLSLPPQADFAFGTGDFSVSLWVFFNNVGTYDYLIDGRNSGQTSGTWSLSINYTDGASGKLMFSSSSSAILTSDTNLIQNQWYYISVSRSGTTSRMHFNGTQVAINSSDSTNYSTSPNTSYIGTRYSTEHSFDGIMGDVRVVKGTALSSYTPPTAPLTAVTNTKLLLNMADGQAIDSAAQSNLTLFGNAKISTSQAKFGNTSLVFDGAGDAAQINSSNVINFGSGPFTIEMFLRLDSGSASGTEIFFDGRGDAGEQGLFPTLEIKHTDDTIDYYVDTGIRISSGTLTRGQFYHVAVCRSGTSTKMFIDGTQVGNTYSDSNVYISGSAVQLGRYFNVTTLNFHGEIDELRISKMARYTSNFTAPAEPFPDKGQ